MASPKPSFYSQRASACRVTWCWRRFFGLDGSEITYNLWCPCYEHSGTAADDDQTPSVAAAASIHAPLLSLFASALALLAAGQRAL